tara:strand:- start:31748 stop:32386 length:639 start_codon:yes stop_codon:yes gene_type:complete
MKTDELITMLASGDVRPQAVPKRRIALHIALGLLATVILMATILGVRSNLPQVLLMPAFWLKVVFVVALARVGWVATMRLSSPGKQAGKVALMITATLVIMWSIAAVQLMMAAPDTRPHMFWGSTWRACPLLIAGLSLPIFIVLLHAMRELAPTRLRLAGAAAGLTAGGAAAIVYCLHCPEMMMPFVSFWYVVGILIPTGIGALIGPRVLRW